jgi:hypothetical protein
VEAEVDDAALLAEREEHGAVLGEGQAEGALVLAHERGFEARVIPEGCIEGESQLARARVAGNHQRHQQPTSNNSIS